MATLTAGTGVRCKLITEMSARRASITGIRKASTSTRTVSNVNSDDGITSIGCAKPEKFSAPPLARLSTTSIARSLLLSTFFTSPLLFRPAFAIFERIANSRSRWLHPDRNPLLRKTIYPLVYKQFCAGRDKAEIGQTSSEIRRLGFSGIVLCYGKEVQVQGGRNLVGYSRSSQDTLDAEVDEWAKGNLATLDMVGEGDWLGIK